MSPYFHKYFILIKNMKIKYLKESLFLNIEDEDLIDMSSEDTENISDKESDIFKKKI